ncbi:hypothetical protein HMI55_003023, partial [Coelomomyces lativittatus]
MMSTNQTNLSNEMVKTNTEPELSEAEREQADREARKREEEEQAKLPYRWRQTLKDVDLIFQLPENIKARDLEVKLMKSKILVKLKKDTEPLLEGDLHSTIKLEESTWFVESNELIINLQKINGMEWWKNVVTHHPAIDTTKIQPENSKLDDLEGETRALVEKMMFDQRQKAMGKPTSEEIKKNEMLEKFKQMHPEMD